MIVWVVSYERSASVGNPDDETSLEFVAQRISNNHFDGPGASGIGLNEGNVDVFAALEPGSWVGLEVVGIGRYTS